LTCLLRFALAPPLVAELFELGCFFGSEFKMVLIDGLKCLEMSLIGWKWRVLSWGFRVELLLVSTVFVPFTIICYLGYRAEKGKRLKRLK
jgi:hypothetical protein